MTSQEYSKIQKDLDYLIEKYKNRYMCCSKYADTAKEVILKCKSVISNYNPDKLRRRKNEGSEESL